MERHWVCGVVMLGLVDTGCASTNVTERTVHTQPTLVRRQQDPTTPPFTSQWELDGRELSGVIVPSTCTIDRSWSAQRTRTTVREPDTGSGAAAMALGSAIAVTSLIMMAARDSGGEIFGAGLLVGCVVTGVGSTTLWMKPSSKTEVIAEEPQRTTSQGPCVLPGELQELGLVARVGPKRLVHLPLASDGNASVTLPDDVALTPGAEIPIVVFRPPLRSDYFRQGQVLGTVRVK
jgi:hypothetical protein